MYMLLPGAVLYAIMKPGQKTEAELRADLEAKYSHNISRSYLLIHIRYNAEYHHHVA